LVLQEERGGILLIEPRYNWIQHNNLKVQGVKINLASRSHSWRDKQILSQCPRPKHQASMGFLESISNSKAVPPGFVGPDRRPSQFLCKTCVPSGHIPHRNAAGPPGRLLCLCADFFQRWSLAQPSVVIKFRKPSTSLQSLAKFAYSVGVVWLIAVSQYAH
jgi:hypothetical protein